MTEEGGFTIEEVEVDVVRPMRRKQPMRLSFLAISRARSASPRAASAKRACCTYPSKKVGFSSVTRARAGSASAYRRVRRSVSP